jgi:hypothetical protein
MGNFGFAKIAFEVLLCRNTQPSPWYQGLGLFDFAEFSV